MKLHVHVRLHLRVCPLGRWERRGLRTGNNADRSGRGRRWIGDYIARPVKVGKRCIINISVKDDYNDFNFFLLFDAQELIIYTDICAAMILWYIITPSP